MARQNKTRDGKLNQKRGVSVAVIPFVEADIVANAGDGSVFAALPDRVMIQRVTSNITTQSGTATATVDVLLNGSVLVNEMPVAAANIDDETLVAAARYSETGGELVLKPGAVPPAAGDLIGELIVEYIELDKVSQELTQHLAS